MYKQKNIEKDFSFQSFACLFAITTTRLSSFLCWWWITVVIISRWFLIRRFGLLLFTFILTTFWTSSLLWLFIFCFSILIIIIIILLLLLLIVLGIFWFCWWTWSRLTRFTLTWWSSFLWTTSRFSFTGRTWLILWCFVVFSSINFSIFTWWSWSFLWWFIWFIFTWWSRLLLWWFIIFTTIGLIWRSWSTCWTGSFTATSIWFCLPDLDCDRPVELVRLRPPALWFCLPDLDCDREGDVEPDCLRRPPLLWLWLWLFFGDDDLVLLEFFPFVIL